MARQIRPPETTKLELARGDYLIVKKRLTAGEKRRIYDRAGVTGGAYNRIALAYSQAIEYLVDWGTFTDSTGASIVIRGKSPDEIGQILDALDEGDYLDIIEAVGAHVDAMDKERAAEKNAQDGANGSSPISPSRSVSDAPMTMS